MVQQDVYLLPALFMRNISYGRLDADRASVVQAAKHAGAHDFIEEASQGLRYLYRGTGDQAFRRPETADQHCPGL